MSIEQEHCSIADRASPLAFMIRVGRRQLLWGEPACQFAPVKRAVVIAIQSGEQRSGRLFHLSKIERAIGIGIEHLDWIFARRSRCG